MGKNIYFCLYQDDYFVQLGIGTIEENGERGIHVTYPNFLKNLTSVVQNTNLNTLKAYFKYRLVQQTSEFISLDFRNEFFSLQQIINGNPEPKTRQKTCIGNPVNFLINIRYSQRILW